MEGRKVEVVAVQTLYGISHENDELSVRQQMVNGVRRSHEFRGSLVPWTIFINESPRAEVAENRGMVLKNIGCLQIVVKMLQVRPKRSSFI